MNNFEFKNPTKIHFGKGLINKISNEIPPHAKVLMLYGSGSIKKNGIFEQVKTALQSFEVIEFGGIPANPEYNVLLKALAVIKEEKITYLLAVGGGSVIDGTKFLASAALFEGNNPWDILEKGIRTEVGMPFGVVLTLPATGSEMNSGSVISRHETKQKLGMGGPGLFPQFSILNPQVISSIPANQIANGIVDAFTHVLEQYMTYPTGANLQDRISESIMQNLIEVAPQILNNPTDYNAQCEFMWSCTMALNGLIQKGVPTDWTVHAIGHELTVLYGIDHAQTLAIIVPSHYRYNFENKKEKLAQYATRVWNITEGSIDQKANLAIDKTEAFFHSVGIKTHLSEYTDKYNEAAPFIFNSFTKRGILKLGERHNITPADVVKIVEMSY